MKMQESTGRHQLWCTNNRVGEARLTEMFYSVVRAEERITVRRAECASVRWKIKRTADVDVEGCGWRRCAAFRKWILQENEGGEPEEPIVKFWEKTDDRRNGQQWWPWLEICKLWVCEGPTCSVPIGCRRISAHSWKRDGAPILSCCLSIHLCVTVVDAGCIHSFVIRISRRACGRCWRPFYLTVSSYASTLRAADK